MVPSVRAMTAGILAFLPPPAASCARPSSSWSCGGLLAAFLVTWALALASAGRARERSFDTTSRSGWGRRRAARPRWRCTSWCCFFPLAAFQGWGWLPLWWLAVLFSYFNRSEKSGRRRRLARADRGRAGAGGARAPSGDRSKPLYRAAIAAVEGEPDPREIALLEAAARTATPRTAISRTSSGSRGADRVECRTPLASTRGSSSTIRPTRWPGNNLANLEFALGRARDGPGPLPGGLAGRGAEREVGGHLLLQPVAGPSAEVRVPGLQRGEVECRPAGPGRRERVRPLEVRLGGLRGRGPGPVT